MTPVYESAGAEPLRATAGSTPPLPPEVPEVPLLPRDAPPELSELPEIAPLLLPDPATPGVDELLGFVTPQVGEVAPFCTSAGVKSPHA